MAPTSMAMRSVDEVVIFRRIADEARVVLDRLVQQRGQILDQRVRQTDAAEEGKWQWTGALKGADVERARTPMTDGFEVLAGAQVATRNNRLAKRSVFEIGLVEHGLAEVGPAEVGPAEV